MVFSDSNFFKPCSDWYLNCCSFSFIINLQFFKWPKLSSSKDPNFLVFVLYEKSGWLTEYKTPKELMDCNKDEAIRAWNIAERKFAEKNYSAARKFSLKAQNLYPELEGLTQMMTTLDVYTAAENKINGEMDWYGILGVGYLADEETIRKQYRKLALMLHPDKNKSLGAEGAFKLVSEAWSLLSDKAKRLVYNEKKDMKANSSKVSAHHSENGFPNFSSNVPSYSRATKSNVRGAPSCNPPHRKANTFWTLCTRCKTHYEYLRIYLNHTLLCPNCHEAFLALEKAPPPNVFKSSNWSSRQPHQNSKHNAASGNSHNSGRKHEVSQNSHTNFECGHFSRTDGFVSSGSTPAKADSVVGRASETVKRERDESQVQVTADWVKGQAFSFKKTRVDGSQSNHVSHTENQMSWGDRGPGMGDLYEARNGDLETQRTHCYYGASGRSISQRELSVFEIRKMLMEKAQHEIREKLKEWSTLAFNKANKKQKNAVNGGPYTKKSSDTRLENKKSLSSSLNDDSEKEDKLMSINVPDPDFHNFDLDRSESSFQTDQVWAAYDDDDGMPRYYARIHKVISLNPFKMRISWLNSRSNSEFGPVDWVGSGFAKTCGDFRIGRHEITGKLNSFSHTVCWRKGLRGIIHIYPGKGETWALFRNWSPSWNENTPDEIIHKYDMVEVVSDYNEEQGLSVVPLIKVTGLRTVFRKDMDCKEVRRILKHEMFRFSHQVPNYLLTGQEALNAPEGCRELDPAATPLDLLHIINDAADKLENNLEKEENSKSTLDEEQNVDIVELFRATLS